MAELKPQRERRRPVVAPGDFQEPCRGTARRPTVAPDRRVRELRVHADGPALDACAVEAKAVGGHGHRVRPVEPDDVAEHRAVAPASRKVRTVVPVHPLAKMGRAVRRTESAPLVSRFGVRLDEQRSRVLPRSRAGEKLTYIANQKDRQLVFLHDVRAGWTRTSSRFAFARQSLQVA